MLGFLFDVLQRHYKKIGVDSDFDTNRKEEVESKVSNYGSMSESCEDDLFRRARL